MTAPEPVTIVGTPLDGTTRVTPGEPVTIDVAAVLAALPITQRVNGWHRHGGNRSLVCDDGCDLCAEAARRGIDVPELERRAASGAPDVAPEVTLLRPAKDYRPVAEHPCPACRDRCCIACYETAVGLICPCTHTRRSAAPPT